MDQTKKGHQLISSFALVGKGAERGAERAQSADRDCHPVEGRWCCGVLASGPAKRSAVAGVAQGKGARRPQRGVEPGQKPD